jgi:hypothetical protein
MENDADKELGDIVLLGQRLDGPYERLGGEGDGAGRGEEHHERGRSSERCVSLPGRHAALGAAEVEE